jgi:hypothetical protein
VFSAAPFGSASSASAPAARSGSETPSSVASAGSAGASPAGGAGSGGSAPPQRTARPYWDASEKALADQWIASGNTDLKTLMAQVPGRSQQSVWHFVRRRKQELGMGSSMPRGSAEGLGDSKSPKKQKKPKQPKPEVRVSAKLPCLVLADLLPG